jgi:TrpR-related protein YerC/YecD
MLGRGTGSVKPRTLQYLRECANVLVHCNAPARLPNAMKTHRSVSPRQEAQAERNLVAALQTMRTPEECRAFLRDLCTPAELQAMADRWAVVECLRQELPYREIHRLTGVSLTTIGRVARYLAQGNGGYALAMRRLESARHG